MNELTIEQTNAALSFNCDVSDDVLEEAGGCMNASPSLNQICANTSIPQCPFRW